MMHQRSQRHGHHGGIVNSFRGGSSRLTYADQRYNKVGGGTGGGGSPNGGSSSSPRNPRWHASSSGKCAMLAIIIMYVSYSTLFSPSPSNGGNKPSGLLSSNNNNNSPQTSPTTDGAKKAPSLPSPLPLLSQPGDSRLADKRSTGLSEPKSPNAPPVVAGRLDETGEEEVDSHDGPDLGRFGEVDAEVERERDFTSPEGGEEGGEEEEEDDDFAGDGRSPTGTKALSSPAEGGEGEDEDDDSTRDKIGREPRIGESNQGRSNEGEGEVGRNSMFQGSEDNRPDGEGPEISDGTHADSVQVPSITDTTHDVQASPIEGAEASGAGGREADATPPVDGTVADPVGGTKEGAVDTGGSGSLTLESPEGAPPASNGNEGPIPVVIPLPRDSDSAPIAEDTTMTNSTDSESPADTEGADEIPSNQQPGPGGDGEGSDLDKPKLAENSQELAEANETVLSETGAEDTSNSTPSTPEVGEADGDAAGAQDNSLQQAVDADAAPTGDETGTKDASEPALDSTAAEPVTPDGETDSGGSAPEVQPIENAGETESNNETSVNRREGDKPENNQLIGISADAKTADAKEEPDAAHSADTSNASGNEPVDTSIGAPVDTPEEGKAIPAEEAESSSTVKAHDAPKPEVLPGADSDGEQRDGTPDDHAGVPTRQEHGETNAENKSPTTLADQEATVMQPKQEDKSEEGKTEVSKLAKDQSDSENEKEEPVDVDSKREPLPGMATADGEGEPAPLEGSTEEASKQGDTGDGSIDNATETRRHDPGPSESEANDVVTKGKNRGTDAENDLPQGNDATDQAADHQDREFDEATEEKRKKRKEKKEPDGEGDSEPTDVTEEAAGVDGADAVPKDRQKKSNLRGANQALEKTDRQ